MKSNRDAFALKAEVQSRAVSQSSEPTLGFRSIPDPHIPVCKNRQKAPHCYKINEDFSPNISVLQINT